MPTPRLPALPWLALAATATLLTFGAACGSCDPPAGDPPTPQAAKADPAVVDLFVFGRLLGSIAPCGCTTEPLGGLNFAFGYIDANSSAASRVVVEPGSFLFPAPGTPDFPAADDEAAWAQAEERASLLQGRFAALGDRLASGLGPTDLRSPAAAAATNRWPLPRTLANLEAGQREALATTGHRLIPIAGGSLGVTTAVDPTSPEAAAIPGLTPVVSAVSAEVAAMRAAGADLTLVQFHAERETVEAWLTESPGLPGLDVAVVGITAGGERARVGAPPAKVGDTWIVEPGEQAQTLTHLRLTIVREAISRGLPRPAAWTVSPSRTMTAAELARVEERLAKFRGDPAADPSFLKTLEGERERLQAALTSAPTAPAAAVFDQVKVTCKLPSDDRASAALRAYDAWVAEQNKARFAGITPPEPAAGEPRYVGMEECEACHSEAYEFWGTTRHAGAYKTLVDDNKQFDLSCVGCHVTGFRQPGGSEVVENHDLQSVQCEQCHGPGSLHVEEPEVNGKPHAIRHDSPIEVCHECHTPEHSDTFEYSAYMRDVLGPGHGAAARQALGPGPTGRELRQAGFDKAGGVCKKPMM